MSSILHDLDVDSYKLSHFKQYPEGVTNISSYIEARDGGDEIVFCGLQGFLKQKMSSEVTYEDVEVLKYYVERHGLPFNEQFWDLVDSPLPLRIQALPEGSIVKPGTVLVQVTNTDDRFPWLTSFVETALLRAIWYPTTVATNSRECKKVIKHYLEKTADNLDGLPFKLHDFGFRGVSSYESGCIGGFAHLINFKGTDTMGALRYCFENYRERMAGFSIPAAEHSTITAWGRSMETEAYANMVDQFAKGGLFAVVSDSYDIYNACEKIWGTELHDKVVNSGGCLVVRPDSGDPVTVVPRVLDLLGDKFGWVMNSKGYRVLPPYIRVIQGDGVNKLSIKSILGKMMINGWSADNIAFGMGGALLQDVTRDDLSFAMKASALSRDGGKTWEGFAKDPVTQSAKKSKAGRHSVVVRDGEFQNIPEAELWIDDDTHVFDWLRDTWVDGELKIDYSLTDIRELAELP